MRVFTGVVVAFPLLSGPDARPSVTLNQNQSITIDGRTVALELADSKESSVRFVRSIEPSPVVTPRTFHLDFTRPRAGSILDADGRGIGLTHRLPGTGAALPRLDPNLRLQTGLGVLNLTTTRSDINTQDHMPTGEYLGVRLSDLGFTGREDFEFSATIPKIPSLDVVGQFGLYVGASSVANIRGGLISTPQPGRYGLFLVSNFGGRDSDLNEVGVMSTGDDLRLTIRRANGRYCLVVENITREARTLWPSTIHRSWTKSSNCLPGSSVRIPRVTSARRSRSKTSRSRSGPPSPAHPGRSSEFLGLAGAHRMALRLSLRHALETL